MTILNESAHAGGFIASLAAKTRSMQNVVILAGSGAARVLTAGMIVGRSIASPTATAVAKTGNIGNGAMGAITVFGQAKLGRYFLRIHTASANAGGFHVWDPAGLFVGSGNVAALFNQGGLSFTLADGATDFVAGDAFEILISGSHKYAQLSAADTTGYQDAAGVLLADVTAPDGVDAKGAIVARDAEVTAAELVWPAGVSAAFKASRLIQLEQLGIFAR